MGVLSVLVVDIRGVKMNKYKINKVIGGTGYELFVYKWGFLVYVDSANTLQEIMDMMEIWDNNPVYEGTLKGLKKQLGEENV